MIIFSECFNIIISKNKLQNAHNFYNCIDRNSEKRLLKSTEFWWDGKRLDDDNFSLLAECHSVRTWRESTIQVGGNFGKPLYKKVKFLNIKILGIHSVRCKVVPIRVSFSQSYLYFFS